MKVMDLIQAGAKQLKEVVTDKLLVKKKSSKSVSGNSSPANEKIIKQSEEEVDINKQDLENNVEFFDPLERPGNFEKAVEHGAAQKVYKIMDNIDPNVQFECCECCGLILPKKGIVEEYPLSSTTSEMKNLGIGIYLYFFYMQFLMVVLFTVCGMYSIIEIATSISYYNEVNNYCNKTNAFYKRFNCTDYAERQYIFLFKYTYVNVEFYDNYVKTLSTASNNLRNYTSNKDTQYVDYSFLNFLLMLVLVILNFIFCTLAFNLNIERDIAKLGVDDYSVMVSNLPLDCKNPDDLKEAIGCVR